MSLQPRLPLFAALALLLACTTEPSSPRPLTFASGIYYTRQVDTVDRIPQIYYIAATGGPEAQLTLGGGSHAYPAISPDRHYLAFATQLGTASAIYVTTPGDTAITPLTPDTLLASQPVWSPSGEFLAFSAYLHGNLDVYCIRRDGTGLERLTSDASRQVVGAWLDETTVAISSDSSGIPQIEVMNATGAQRHAITGNPDTITQANGSPAWSSTANAFAFVRSGSTPISIYTMNRDGSSAHLVIAPSGLAFFTAPAWSPDGTRLTAIAGRTGTSSSSLITVALASGAVDTILTTPEAILGIPYWAN